jgi:hypothetical protein
MISGLREWSNKVVLCGDEVIRGLDREGGEC